MIWDPVKAIVEKYVSPLNFKAEVIIQSVTYVSQGAVIVFTQRYFYKDILVSQQRMAFVQRIQIDDSGPADSVILGDYFAQS